jgi:hypothetical protein
MCPDLDMRDTFYCDTAQARRPENRPECALIPANYKKLGDIDVAKTGSSGDDREVLLAFADRARRLKPDAVIEFRQEQRRGSYVWRLQGLAIQFNNPACKP